ncbi:MAG: selenocysteine-specific translation elongation factor [Actinobacteria bacterium]|nr:selenocysteine-specific translation elongation factor [Actinomycetota bacterium]
MTITQVIATAGHVDHGKSTLVRALTGMEPDRWEEERRRGLTIDLGFAWMQTAGPRVAFVDVPGHERFVPNMLAGLGPVPAVLLVVAADGGWMPQSAEHLAAIDALGIARGLLVVTRADLADPAPARRRAQAELATTSLRDAPALAVSAVTGAGLPELHQALATLAGSLPVPDPAAPVRLWVDRAFTIRGSGTVVTGTLPAGTVEADGELLLTPSLRPVRVRAIESLGQPATAARGVTRVALNLRGVPKEVPARGMALVEPGRWTLTGLLDVRVDSDDPARLPRELIVHLGSARTPARLRVLGRAEPDGGKPAVLARLTLRDQLPLHVGDRILLRDPGAAGLFIVGAAVLDLIPPPLKRRGAATAAAAELARWPDPPAAGDLLRRHRLLRTGTLTAMGVTGGPPPVAGEWQADPSFWSTAADRLTELTRDHAEQNPLAVGLPVEAARAALALPDRALVEALVAGGAVILRDGYLTVPGASAGSATPSADQPGRARAKGPAEAGSAPLPDRLLTAVQAVHSDLAATPFRAPEAARLRELGLDTKSIAAAARAGLLLRVSDQVVLAPGADRAAAQALAALPQPFTTAEARQALATTRRVAIPLLEFLDRARITERLPDDRRRLR